VLVRSAVCVGRDLRVGELIEVIGDLGRVAAVFRLAGDIFWAENLLGLGMEVSTNSASVGISIACEPPHF
jgi:hypothetical protein